MCVLIRIASLRRFKWLHKIYHFKYKNENHRRLSQICSFGIFFPKGTQGVRSLGKRAISVRATEVLLYFSVRSSALVLWFGCDCLFSFLPLFRKLNVCIVCCITQQAWKCDLALAFALHSSSFFEMTIISICKPCGQTLRCRCLQVLLMWEAWLYITVELQWLEHLWNHENMFETGVVRADEC